MGYGGGGGGGGGSGGSGGSGGGGGYRTVGGGSAFGGSDEQELPSYYQAPEGSIRFNTDSKKLEVYIGGPVGYGTLPNGIWMEVDSWSPQLQTGGTRGLLAAGYSGSAYIKNIDYFNVDTTGNALDFGDLQNNSGWIGALADRTRAIFLGDGGDGGGDDNCSFVTIASTGDSQTFGNLTTSHKYYAGLASPTRGVRGGGYPAVDVIDFCTIQSTGNFVDFGNLTNSRLTHGSGVSSPTRGIWGGGATYTPAASVKDTIDYITIATQGNAADFGNLTQARKAVSACANSVRGIWSGGYTPTYVNTMDYVTIATLGNATDFGDSTWTGAYKSGASSPTRGTWSGGRTGSTRQNTMDYVQIMTLGDAVDFGDLVSMHDGGGGCSNGHGGL